MVFTGDTPITYSTTDGSILSACAIGPLNIPYGRVSDRLQDVMDSLYTNFVPWEWWIDYTGKVHMGQERGNDRTATIKIVHGERLNEVDAQRSIKQTAQRVRVTGSGEGKEQDDNTSDWQVDATAMNVINTFYETVEGNKEISKKDMADILAKVLLTQLKDPREEVTINDVDLLPYTANDVDVADYITVTDFPARNWTGLSGSQRIKTLEKTIDAISGEVVNLTLTKKRTDIADRLAFLQKKLNEFLTSNTAISKLMDTGSKQGKINPEALEDIWSITATNKFFYTVPEEGDTDPMLLYLANVGAGAYHCDKDMFYLQTTGSLDDVQLYSSFVELNWEDNPKFSCEFEIDTAGAADPWTEGNYTDIGISNSGLTLGFYFRIKYSSGAFHIYVCLETTVPPNYEIEILPTGGITYDKKYKLEAEVDWEARLVKYSFGSETQDLAIVGAFPFPYTEGATGQQLCPMLIRVVNFSANIKRVVVFKWK
jgi:hypothetical protein